MSAFISGLSISTIRAFQRIVHRSFGDSCQEIHLLVEGMPFLAYYLTSILYQDKFRKTRDLKVTATMDLYLSGCGYLGFTLVR